MSGNGPGKTNRCRPLPAGFSLTGSAVVQAGWFHGARGPICGEQAGGAADSIRRPGLDRGTDGFEQLTQFLLQVLRRVDGAAQLGSDQLLQALLGLVNQVGDL